ncbi:Hypothetical Protein FCC1311_003382 [Hondaea fermentalgiana]|uniref:Uncharacterized protein n=1 Tax=Hondaea fermentalgiana TaxID=2315210 RepID=A0A2R5FZG7_9STRA|nr:Hypothetical Protein FCC1311_003382 [Hondaea fermentalgiana]|eukprot:GBG24120.1 Hypothetical Protein FCC1311_003382 [Hondaea fermentalgiana]
MEKKWAPPAVLDVAMESAPRPQLYTGPVAPACGAGSSSYIYQSNTRCIDNGLNGVESATVSLDTCCGTATDTGIVAEGDTQTCRDVTSLYPYCETPDDCDVSDTDILTISLDIATAEATDTCCRSCKCVGDPDCVSFDNTPASWVLCDGRRKSNCKQGRSPCRRQRDHMGNRCKWIKKDPEYLGWDVDGSPCQVNWEKSGHPTMLMYQTGLFSVNLTLGERGVIDSVLITTGESGADYVLDADACFEHDPRLNPNDYAAAEEAWTSGSGDAIPDTWSVSLPNSVEIMWNVVDDATQSIVEIYCTQPPGTNRTRLDVKRLYSLVNETDAGDEDGFCITNTIDRGLATTKYANADDDYEFQQKCLVQTLPGLLATCKIIMGAECTPYSLDDYITEWCQNADITNTDLDGDVDECIRMLVQKGSETVRGERWTRYICQLNRVDDVDECMALVSQFGWAQFLMDNSDGLVDSSNELSSCASSVTAYSTLEGENATCAFGIFVEYLPSGEATDADADWVQAFFIPADLVPCNNELVIDGTQYPELFAYPFRFRQCTLDSSCLADSACAPTLGFDASVTFESTCEDLLRSDDECFSTQCPMNADVVSSPQAVCEDAPSAPLEIGSCDSCCVTGAILESDSGDDDLDGGTTSEVVDSETCRQLIIQSPYCDTTTQSDICDSLTAEDGEAVLTLEFTMNTTEMSCCRSCAAWGDPLISSFYGETSKWINCDGRNSRCSVKEDVCESQLDHAGNACVYNATIADLIEIGSDIGAYGSPCQSNVSLSGEAVLTMYETEGFRVTITNGERSVITHATIELTNDVYELDPSQCFNDDPYDAWILSDGSDPTQGTLDLTFSDTDRDNEKQWTVRDSDTGIFMKIVCLRRVSQAGYVGGYRMNIESLIDTVANRTSSSGFCETGTIDYGLATINSNGEICQENIEDLVEFCRAVAEPSCMKEQVADLVKDWCDTANVYVSYDNHAKKCVNAIKPSRSNSNKVLADWQAVYCDAVSSLRDASQSEETWQAFCVSRLQNEGFAAVVAELGDGRLTSSSQSEYCASSATEYGLKSDSDGCMPGVTVEYQTTEGNWTELFFVPQNLPPCGDTLEISATDFPELFVHPIRFVQCELDTTACPVASHTDSYCAAAQGYTISYMFTQADSVCRTQHGASGLHIRPIVATQLRPTPLNCLIITSQAKAPGFNDVHGTILNQRFGLDRPRFLFRSVSPISVPDAQACARDALHSLIPWACALNGTYELGLALRAASGNFWVCLFFAPAPTVLQLVLPRDAKNWTLTCRCQTPQWALSHISALPKPVPGTARRDALRPRARSERMSTTQSTRRTAAAAVMVAVVAVLASTTESMAPSCGAGGNSYIYQSNTRCVSNDGVTSLESPSASYSTCCGVDTDSGIVSADDAQTCRGVTSVYPYCESPDDCDVDEDDTLIISLAVDTADASDTCCRSCKCVGDPDCVSFDSTPASWVLCDGRRQNNCKQGRSPCRRQRDHMGNRCQWVKKDPEYLGWDIDGSPCQVDWEKSGHPTMLMYQTGLFAVNLTLGERGVIDSVLITTGDAGDNYILDSDACFEHDPRLNPNDYAAAKEAWTSESGNAIPDTWSVSTPNSVEIMWKVVDDATQSIVEIYCTQPPGTSRTRLDIKRLYSLVNETDASDEDGFCVTNTIDRGLATTKFKNADDDYEFQQKCLVQTLPGTLATCKIIMGAECTPYSLDDYITEWCQNADITNTDLAGDVDECIRMLVKKGTEAERSERWTRYICQLNRVDDVDECMALVSQFGWAQFLMDNSDGLVDSGNDSSSCASSVAAYSKLEGDNATCALGIFVEYLPSGDATDDDAVWEQAFFIPADLVPCNNELAVSGSEYAELFAYPIRFRQCSLDASCLADSACAPTLGFDVSINFSTDDCPPTTSDDGNLCFDAECPMNSDVVSNPQSVCETVPNAPLELGSCESCCVADSILSSDDSSDDSEDEQTCRQLTIQAPYCDTNQESMQDICDKLVSEEGQGVLTVDFTMDTTEMNCCRSCAAWGDPLISNFYGETSKWINCDGRNSRCSVKENVCTEQLDHAGNACVYNPDIAALIKTGSDIGAYGSPCQSNVSLSGEAILTMYETDGFRVNITNGERSVITHATIETVAGEIYALDASQCFNEDPYDAWTLASGEDAQSGSLALAFTDTDREHEKKWTVRDTASGIFMKIVCLRRVSKSGYIGGYRMNIETLIDTVTDRVSSSGFCESGTIDYGLATINSNGEVCQENIEDIVAFCRAVASPSCMKEQIVELVNDWCDTANVFSSYTNHAKKCVKAIKPGRSNKNKVLADWQAVYCDAVNSLRDPSQSEETWQALCVSRLQNEGFASVVADLGDGRLTSSSQSSYCANSATEYSLKSESDGCMPGVSVEYRNSDGDWVEAFFVPQNLPPCGDSLDILATDYPELFLHPIRFLQCELDTTACPVASHEDSYCAAAQGYTISYMFSQAGSVCNDDV